MQSHSREATVRRADAAKPLVFDKHNLITVSLKVKMIDDNKCLMNIIFVIFREAVIKAGSDAIFSVSHVIFWPLQVDGQVFSIIALFSVIPCFLTIITPYIATAIIIQNGQTYGVSTSNFWSKFCQIKGLNMPTLDISVQGIPYLFDGVELPGSG